MEARVIKPFFHTNTGRLWREGSVFSGDASSVAQLSARGYLATSTKLPTVDAANDGEPPLAALTVAELRAMAEVRGIDVPARARKADVIAAIVAAGR